MESQKNLVKQACDILGSQAALSRLLCVSPGMVNQVVKGRRPLPVKHGLRIEKATFGVISRQKLFPKDHKEIWGTPVSKRRSAATKQTP